jgi:DNA modification methylase
VIQTENATVYIGNNLDILPILPDNSVDSIVTDPPYELGFMGKSWDSSGIAYNVDLWRECLQVLKPGGHLLAFSGSRTYHRMVVAIEDAGFEIRDMITWISNKTFPKSHNLKGEWQGWGTALKPTVEPIVMARKPLIGTVAANVLEHGTGALNIDGSRIGTTDETARKPSPVSKSSPAGMGRGYAMGGNGSALGRWPANVILDEYSAGLLDEQSGDRPSGGGANGVMGGMFGSGKDNPNRANSIYFDSGGASRFFYVARASKRDRNEGLETLSAKTPHKRLGDQNALMNPLNTQLRENFHPTVKPTTLMRYLVKLVTPPGGTVLDPFTGSGSTGKAAILEGFTFIGCEMTEDYLPIIQGRLEHAEATAAAEKDKRDEALF